MRAREGGHRQEGVPQEVRREAHDAELRAPDRPAGRLAVTTANGDCQDELAQIGPPDFIDEYGDDVTTPVTDAMDECIAEAADQILNPGDYIDDGTDE